MKKIALIILLCFIYCAGNSQNTTTQNLGAPRTLVVNKGGFKSDSALILPNFPDTTSANQSQYVKYYAGNVIRVGDTVYIRNNTATKWIKVNIVNGNFVPYTGATQDVDLGNNDFFCDEISTTGYVSSNGNAFLYPNGDIFGDSLTLRKNNDTTTITLRTSDSLVGQKNLYLPNSNNKTLLSSINSTSATSNGNVVVDLKSVTEAGNKTGVSVQVGDTLKIKSNSTGFTNSLIANNPSFEMEGNQNYYFPNASGTIALTSNLTSYIDSLKRSSDSVFARKGNQWKFQYKDSTGGGNFVPYTGATQDVDLGNHSITLNIQDGYGFIQKDYDSLGIRTYVSQDDNASYLEVTNPNNSLSKSLYTNNGLKIYDGGNSFYKLLQIGTASGNSTIYLPDASGTLALNSQFIDSLKRSTDSIFAYKNGSWRFQYKDSVGNGGAGTVTSVATGYGLAGGTITTTGTLIADTSVSGLSGKYLRISDTANKWVSSVTGLNDSTIRVVKDGTTTDITIRSSATVTAATRLVTTVYNNSGSTITKGSVVYINGRHSSNLPTIALAQANTEQNSYATFALVENDITNNNSGTVVQAGNITNLNLPTLSYRDGQLIYLSPTVAGGIDTVKPLAPNHIVKIGTVTRAHPTFGSIEIKIENGWQLDELSDVQIAAVPNDSTLLQFSRVDSLWHSVSPTTAIGSRYIKPSDTASMLTNYAKTSAVNLKVNISDTASMLSKYFRKSDTLLSTKFRVNFSASTTEFPVIIKNTNASAVQSNVLSFDCSATGADQPVFVNLASTSAKGMVFFASNQATSSSPAGAGFQIYSTSATNFPGQMYFDGGAHNSSSIIFRTAQTSGTITQRMRIFAGGNVSISSSATDPGYLLNVNGTLRANQFYLSSLNTAPATASSTGTTGEIRIDANYIYICTATNTWKRAAIATW